MPKPDQLLEDIESLQIKTGNKTYPSGLFPSIRSHPWFGLQREDSNIYFSAATVFILLSIKNHLSPDNQLKIRRMGDRLKESFRLYESTRVAGLYNFYQTNPVNAYPNGIFLSKFSHFQLADDADDTALINLCKHLLNDNVESSVEIIRKSLVRFANLSIKMNRSAPEKYRSLPAYGVWFGSGKMPVEMDLCVLTNILLLVFHFGLPLNEQDLASLQCIRLAIESDDITKQPFQISYTYPIPAVILYHIARLADAMTDPDQYLPVEQLIGLIQHSLKTTRSALERLMLSTAGFRLGVDVPEVTYTIEEIREEGRSFGFFKAPMLKGTDGPILNWLAPSPLFHLNFDCEAFYLCLALEYEVMKTANYSG